MNRLLIIGVLCMSAAVCHAQDTQKPRIPDGVKYTFIDDKQDALVRDFVAAQFRRGQAGVAELFVDECTCAPGCWRLVKGLGIKRPKITAFSVPNERTGKLYKMDGAQIQDTNDLNQISQYLTDQLGITPTIRRLTTKEIGRFWVVIPFDIQEPLFVAESGSRQFVLCLKRVDNGRRWHVWWIDALTEYEWGEGHPKQIRDAVAPNTALEPITPVSPPRKLSGFENGFRVAGSHRRRGSAHL